VNTAVFTARVHGIVRTVYTAVHEVYGPRTPACKGRVHGASTAVYRVRLHGRLPRTRPCLRPVYTAAHGGVQTVYTAVHGPRTWSVRDPITAVCAARIRPCTVNTAVFTLRVHGIVRTVYGAIHEVYGPCIPTCKDRVHGASTAVYRVHLHGRVPRTRPCLRPVYTAAHGRVQTVYTAVHGPRTWSVRDPIMAVCAARIRPCTVNTAVFTLRVHGIVRTVYAAIHEVYGPCTPTCKDRVHGASTAVYRVHLHGRVTCTRASFRSAYTARERSCTRSVHGCERSCGRTTAVYTGGEHARVHDRRVRTGRDTAVCTGHGRTMCTTLARRCSRSVHGRGHVLCTCMGHECGRLCKRSEAKAEAEAKTETDAKAEAKVILTRPRLAVFVYNSGSTDLLGQRDLLRPFETVNYPMDRAPSSSISVPYYVPILHSL